MGSSEEGREKQGPGFTIIDRRGSREEESTPPEHERAQARAHPLPRVDFASLVVSFATSALYHLGQVADPETGKPAPVDLGLAQQTIDTLEVLQEKTRGNLTPEEEELLTHLLTDLRMRFVQAPR